MVILSAKHLVGEEPLSVRLQEAPGLQRSVALHPSADVAALSVYPKHRAAASDRRLAAPAAAREELTASVRQSGKTLGLGQQPLPQDRQCAF
jgi:hypothetical protein